MNTCPRCKKDLGDNWDFWITLCDYTDPESGDYKLDYPICPDCWKIIKECLEN